MPPFSVTPMHHPALTHTLAALAAGSSSWLKDLFSQDSVAHAVLILGLVAAAGLAIGTVRVFKVSLGVAGVLFAGLAFGQMGFSINQQVTEFAREFGLILFVYTIGIQVGPGFIASLRRNGLPLNLMAAAIVLLGVAMTLLVYFAMMHRQDLPAAVGLFAGATTNTPSLAAAGEALRQAAGDGERAAQVLKQPGIAYAVAYPFGIIGIILTMLLVRAVFRIDPQHEAELLAAMQPRPEPLQTLNLEVRNPNLDGVRIRDLPTLGDSGVVISRVLHDGQIQVARGDTILHSGDVIHAVGPRRGLEQLRLIVGVESPIDLKGLPAAITSRRLLVTRTRALGRSIQELDPLKRFGLMVTRISRAEIELPPTAEVKLQFGDTLVVVGEEAAIARFAQEVGDAPRQLNHPQVIPLFLGIALGVLVGSWPLSLPGLPAPVKLGLAGGPLIVAIILSRLGNIGPLVWYMPISANFLLREVGIVLFLAAVGLRSGDQFLQTLAGPGLLWMGYGALITLVPLLVVGFAARIFYKLNYLSLCGLLAGSMTDPPALAFAGAMTGSESPSIAYATVYPLVMLLRVLSAQAMVILLFT